MAIVGIRLVQTSMAKNPDNCFGYSVSISPPLQQDCGKTSGDFAGIAVISRCKHCCCWAAAVLTEMEMAVVTFAYSFGTLPPPVAQYQESEHGNAIHL
jgi:hypothetical protein